MNQAKLERVQGPPSQQRDCETGITAFEENVLIFLQELSRFLGLRDCVTIRRGGRKLSAVFVTELR